MSPLAVNRSSLIMPPSNQGVAKADQLVLQLHAGGHLSSSAVRMGLGRVINRLEDYTLDVPKAVDMVVQWAIDAVEGDVLDPSFIREVTLHSRPELSLWALNPYPNPSPSPNILEFN